MTQNFKSLGLAFLISYFFYSFSFAQSTNYLGNLDTKSLIRTLETSASKGLESVNLNILKYKDILKNELEEQLSGLTLDLNKLRDYNYQIQVYKIAKKYEGKNIYHDYRKGYRNDDSNTCANAWCQVLSDTGIPKLKPLATGNIYFYPKTFEEERGKKNPNLWQKKPKYINVNDVIKHAESYGFLAIDLDLTQRGDFCVQYYEKKRVGYKFGPQHISIVDQIILWKDGWFELRDWHEGIENYPFVYRTGSNLPSSFNNIFSPENVYYGFQEEQGTQRSLYNKNPNVCQGYAYFGNQVEKAKPLIKQINHLRKQLFLLNKIEKDFLNKEN